MEVSQAVLILCPCLFDLVGRISGSLGQFGNKEFEPLANSFDSLHMAAVFEQFGASKFDHYYDMDLTNVKQIVRDVAEEFNSFNIG